MVKEKTVRFDGDIKNNDNTVLISESYYESNKTEVVFFFADGCIMDPILQFHEVLDRMFREAIYGS